MTAAYLSKVLTTNSAQGCQITLVEASDIPTVGVGEATIPIFGDFFRVLDIPEAVWMERCHATFKLAIRFDGWLDGTPNDTYWHTFGTIPLNVGARISVLQHWLQQKLQGDTTPFATACHESVQLCMENRAPKSAYNTPSPAIPYAFHLDAGLLAALLKEYALERGVKHISDKVVNTQLDEQGFIRSVTMEQGDEVAADLFIDCSGFRSLLLEQVLGVPWESYADSLFCDRAIAIGTPYAEDDPYNEQGNGLQPFTTATALHSGWCWHTPLIYRGGNGYVYSSHFATPEQAEAEFRQYLGIGEDLTARHLNMRVGKMRRLWVKNCVAIGLAGGFIEPLESTGLALIQVGLNALLHHFPDRQFSPALAASYNRILTANYENVRDFIILHYCLTKREDTPFWKSVVHDTRLPDQLKAQLAEWKSLWPNTVKGTGHMFTEFNYVSVLAGMDYLPTQHLPALNFVNTDYASQYFQRVKSRSQQLTSQLPTQGEYFRQLERIRAFRAEEW